MTVNICGCSASPGRVFMWCHLHNAAPRMLAALQELVRMEYLKQREPITDDYDMRLIVARTNALDAIALATGKVTR